MVVRTDQRIMGDWKLRAKALKRDVRALYLARGDPRVPWYAKLLGALIVGYALSPIDLIPDFIPVVGFLDDLILLPAGILLLIRFIPTEVMDEYRIKANNPELVLSKNWIFGVVIVLIWIAAIALTARLVLQWFKT